MKTQVAIIGGGPSGLLLALLLRRQGIESVVLERQTKTHVLGRIRAGVLERGLCELLRRAGVGDRLDREGFRHDGTLIADGEDVFRLDFAELTGHSVTVYGQTEVTRDLYDALEADGAQIVFEATGVALDDIDTDRPRVTYSRNGENFAIDCDLIAGCDGFHGVSRKSIPADRRREFEKVYPFGWLGVLTETPPVHHELIYARSEHGFALCSMRNEGLSRYYIQSRIDARPEDWSDEAFWNALRERLPTRFADALVTGPSIEKSIAPLRSFVCEPMRYGRLFLCGDAAHIVPPTGAKGLNTAAGDVNYLHEAILDWFGGDDGALNRYSPRALSRVWQAERFSWWFSSLLHNFPDRTGFDARMQRAELAFLRSNPAAQRAMAESYVGVPY